MILEGTHKGVKPLEETANLASNLLGGHLAAEHRNHDRRGTQAQAGNNPGDIKGSQRVRVHRLDQRPDAEDQTRNHQCLPPAQLVGKWPGQEAGDESAKLLQSHSERVDAGGISGRVAIVTLERLESQDATHDAAVVTKQKAAYADDAAQPVGTDLA